MIVFYLNTLTGPILSFSAVEKTGSTGESSWQMTTCTVRGGGKIENWDRERSCSNQPSVTIVTAVRDTKRSTLSYLRIPPDFRGGPHLFIETAIRHRVSPEFIRSRNYVPMAFTAGSPPAQGQ